jgi:ATPase related to the helicase subunit of the Holliday junction resolvase
LPGKVPSKRAALLYGPPGVGKTSLVEAIVRDYKLELLELNASDYRRAEDIRKTVGVAAFRRPLFGRLLLILLDEVDGMSARGDAGGIEELLRIIPNTQNPIVLTANDPWQDALKPLREQVLMVQFKELTLNNVVGLLQNICNKEGIECDREALRYIAEKNMGDVRACINDLEAVAEGYGKVTMELVRALVRGRDKSIDLWRTLNGIFYAKEGWQARKAVLSSEEDYETLLAWLNDNIPNKYGDPEDAFRAWDALSRASLFLSRAKGGDWDFLTYVFDMMGPGVAMARKSGEILKNRYAYPSKITMMAKLREIRELRDSVAAKVAPRLGVSMATFKADVLPYLLIMFRQGDVERAAGMVVSYDLTEDEVQYLAGARAREIMRAAEKVRQELRRGAKAEATAKKGAEQPQERPAEKRGQLTLDLFGVPSQGASEAKKEGRRRSSRSSR